MLKPRQKKRARKGPISYFYTGQSKNYLWPFQKQCKPENILEYVSWALVWLCQREIWVGNFSYESDTTLSLIY